MKLVHISMLMVMSLLIAFSPNTATAQADGAEFQTEEDIRLRKEQRKTLYTEHKNAVKAIKEDASLSQAQKRQKIQNLDSELRESVGKRHKDQRDDKMKGRKKSKRNAVKGHRSEEEIAAWKDEKRQLKREVESINNDDSLTKEEKRAKKRALLDGKAYKIKKARAKGKRARLNKKSQSYYKDSMTTKDIQKGKKEVDIVRTGLSEKRKAQAYKRLDYSEKVLMKKLDKGQISQNEYDKQIQRINEVRGQLKY